MIVSYPFQKVNPSKAIFKEFAFLFRNLHSNADSFALQEVFALECRLSKTRKNLKKDKYRKEIKGLREVKWAVISQFF